MRIAEVAFNLPLDRTFHYLIPEDLSGQVQRGVRVAAPFGPREWVGWVVRRVSHSPIRELKSIRRVIDPSPIIDDERWALAEWIAAYYCCSQGEALSVMVPSALRLRPPSGPSASEPPLIPGGPELSNDQRAALTTIDAALAAQRFRTFLVHGVTASGKTELYLQAIARVLQLGRSAICLVPEIALTPQTIDRFRGRFGGVVGVWHSRLTARQRAETWARTASGECRIIVGARSAVFAPVTRLGIIVVDEEQEATYKQEDAPRYHAREVAVARAKQAGALVLLGSATPSVESFYEAAKRRAVLMMPERVTGQALPDVEIVDMREELAMRRRAGPLSNRLQRALEQTVQRGEQAMILLNRRGFARSAQCKTCGSVLRCQHCSVPLVYHAGRGQLVCHYCNGHEPPPDLCPQCRKGYLQFKGAGTERIESELHRLFPMSSIARMDRDSTTKRESHRELYDALKSRQISLLVGTQMIAKGLDFPDVTLVGVASADTALNLPDFRAGERTFDLLTQVAGRAGRGRFAGRVIIQTYCPDHYAIQAAKLHDYASFYAAEIRMRRRLKLPPFAHLIELTVIGGKAEHVQAAAEGLAEKLCSSGTKRSFSIVGPAPHRIPRLRRTYRVCLLMKGREVAPMADLLRRVIPGRKWHGLPVLIDVDPL